MPADVFDCKICHQPVTRPKSYAYQDGRACRTHQEAQQARDKQIKYDEEQKARSIVKAEKRLGQVNRLRREGADGGPEHIYDGIPKCMACEKRGIYAMEFNERMMIAERQLALHGKTFPFFVMSDGHLTINQERALAIRAQMQEDERTLATVDNRQPQIEAITRMLACVVPGDEEKIHLWKWLKNHRIYGFTIQMLGYAVLCLECVSKHKIELPKPQMPGNSEEQLRNMLVLGFVLQEYANKKAVDMTVLKEHVDALTEIRKEAVAPNN